MKPSGLRSFRRTACVSCARIRPEPGQVDHSRWQGFDAVAKDCVSNVRELGWENSDVIDLVLQLRDGDYLDSEWCENGRGAYAACDAYSVRVKEWVETANKEMLIKYFVKFAINKLGTMVLTISCHT